MSLTPRPLSLMRHRLLLCRNDDVVVENAELRLRREAVLWAWAEITPRSATGFTPGGQAWAVVNDERNRRTHEIRIRYRYDVNVSILAWLYEQRMKSSPRWFRILKVEATENRGSPYAIFDCRLVERGDDLISPSEPSTVATGLPHGVKL